jgi:nitrate reductase NapD
MTMAGGGEVHVAGLVVHAYPEAIDSVTKALDSVPGAHVHAASRDGKLVVTIEAAHAGEIADRTCYIQTIDGVHAAAMVYQHSEPEAAMDDEVEL